MRPSRIVPAAAAVLALGAPAVASAHLRTGTVAVGVGASVATPPPFVRAALAVRVYESDRALRLTVRPGHSVVVLGYLGEPFLRLGRAGVAVDASSPTATAADLARRGERGWHVRPGRSVTWHDARVQALPATVRRASWRIPLVVDGRRTALRGTVRRLRAPPPWPWAALLAAFVAAGLLLARTAAPVAGAAAGAAACATAAVFALDAYASPGTWIAGADELVFAAAGLAALRLGTREVRLFASLGLGLLAVAVGASKGAVYLHADVLAVVPSDVARLLVTAALGLGLAAIALAGLALAGAESRERLHAIV